MHSTIKVDSGNTKAMRETNSTVTVAVRVRPESRAVRKCLSVDNNNQLSVGNKVFTYDHVFGEDATQEQVYGRVVERLVQGCFKGFNSTIFAYGQTGSGKTYTMSGIESMVANDVFKLLESDRSSVSTNDTVVLVSFFEIYGGRIQDLLNHGKRLKVLEDGKGEVVVTGLMEFEANNPKHLLDFIESANK